MQISWTIQGRTKSQTMAELEEIALNNFRAYLRIPSVHPDVNYDECVAFLKRQADELNLSVQTYELVAKKPIVILTWVGSDPKAPSILLNSHMDVVPVYPELWKHDPFGAELDENGNIFARGSQDMKCVGIQYLEAIRRFQVKGITFKRTIHLSFVPDEEVGGLDGMAKFVKTHEFKELNVGFALDEGIASENDTFLVFYAERAIWHAEFTIPGSEGHGSLLLPNTAGEKLRRLIDLVMDFRQTSVDKLSSNPDLTIGDVTSANLTILNGGVEPNVIPPVLTLTVDFRLAIDVDHEQFEKQLRDWMAEAGDGITLRFIQKNPPVAPTILDDSNPYWVAIRDTFKEISINIKTAVFTGGTDSRYCRAEGIPVIGFSPMNNTPVLLHANDEFLNKDVFLRGIGIYEKIIPSVANL